MSYNFHKFNALTFVDIFINLNNLKKKKMKTFFLWVFITNCIFIRTF